MAEEQKARDQRRKIESLKQKRKGRLGLLIKGFGKSEARGLWHLESVKEQEIVLMIVQKT